MQHFISLLAGDRGSPLNENVCIRLCEILEKIRGEVLFDFVAHTRLIYSVLMAK